MAKGKVRLNRGYKIDELQEIARICEIPTHKEYVPMTVGWDGAPKGMFQVLYETGWIDPEKMDQYRAKAPKDWLDGDGNVKDEHRDFVLTDLLARRQDFANELTSLEWITSELTTDDCCVLMIYSPKYHCEIAGEGIEMCWGFLKKYYRRKFTAAEKSRSFSRCVDEALAATAARKDTIRKYAGHVYAYMMAYRTIETEQGDDAELSFQVVEKFLKKYRCHRSSADQEGAVIQQDVSAALNSE